MGKKKIENTITAGVDEAGRGPIIGPMVMVAIAVTKEQEQKLQWLGVKDSKLLSRQAREEMFDRIHEIVEDFRIEVIEADAIDNALDDINCNLNWLEAESSARMLSEIKPNKAILDCPSTNPPAYKEYVQKKLSFAVAKECQIIAEHKADFKYPVVAAASIVAKVIRDRAIDKIKNDIDIDFGSGYLSDEKTQNFLRKYYKKHANVFRKNWKPYKKIIDEKNQKKLGEF